MHCWSPTQKLGDLSPPVPMVVAPLFYLDLFLFCLSSLCVSLYLCVCEVSSNLSFGRQKYHFGGKTRLDKR